MGGYLLNKQIEMYSLMARMEAVKADIKSMDAAGNYAETAYLSQAQELEHISQKLMALANS